MIREAVEADIPKLVEMGREFASAAGQNYDADIAEGTIRNLIAGESSVVLVNDECTAMLAGLSYRHFFNGDLVAQELWWWGSSGGKLLDAFETWAKNQGAIKVLMICLDALQPDRVAKVYKRRGYVPLEQSFLRHI